MPCFSWGGCVQNHLHVSPYFSKMILLHIPYLYHVMLLKAFPPNPVKSNTFGLVKFCVSAKTCYVHAEVSNYPPRLSQLIVPDPRSVSLTFLHWSMADLVGHDAVLAGAASCGDWSCVSVCMRHRVLYAYMCLCLCVCARVHPCVRARMCDCSVCPHLAVHVLNHHKKVCTLNDYSSDVIVSWKA